MEHPLLFFVTVSASRASATLEHGCGIVLLWVTATCKTANARTMKVYFVLLQPGKC